MSAGQSAESRSGIDKHVEGITDVDHRLISLAGIQLEAAADYVADGAGQRRLAKRLSGSRGAANQGAQCVGGTVIEGRPARQCFEQHGPKREHVASLVRGPAGPLLG